MRFVRRTVVAGKEYAWYKDERGKDVMLSIEDAAARGLPTVPPGTSVNVTPDPISAGFDQPPIGE